MEDRSRFFHLATGKGWMHKEHKAGFAQFLCDRKSRLRPPSGPIKSTFQINLGAGTLETRNTTGGYLFNNPVATPIGCKVLRTYISIEFVLRMDATIVAGNLRAAGTEKLWQTYCPIFLGERP